MCLPGMVVECSPRATQGSKVKPRTGPRPHSFGVLQCCPGLGESSFPSAQQGSVLSKVSPTGVSPSRGQGWVIQLQPRLGVQAWLLIGHSASLWLSPTLGHPLSPQPLPSEWPRCWEAQYKTVLAILQTWRHPRTQDRCKEPNPLIRTGRLGPHPPQAQADFSGRKTCSLSCVLSRDAGCRSLGSESLPLAAGRAGVAWLQG